MAYTTTIPKFRPAQVVTGGCPPIVEFLSNAAITKDTFVDLDATNGKVDPGAEPAVRVLGVALNSTSGADLPVLVALAYPGVVFSGFAAAGTPLTTAMTGDNLRLNSLTGLDLGNSGVAKVIGLDSTDSTAAAGTRVLFTIHESAYIGPGGSGAAV